MKKFKMMKWQDRLFVTLNSLILAVIFLVTLYPMIFVLSASISDPQAVSAGKMVLFPVGFTLHGYQHLLKYSEIWIGYANAIFYTVVGTVMDVAVTIPAAYALSRRDMRGRNIIMGLFLFTMYFSGGLIPGYLNVQSLGLLNTRAIMLISGLLSVYNLIVSRTFFANSIPWELHEAAQIDGASDIKTFSSIVLPLSKPIMAVMALYYGVGHWNTYFNAMIYLKDRAKFPLQLFLREILLQSKAASSALMSTADAEAVKALLAQQDTANLLKYAVIVVSTIPMLIIYPFIQKYFAKGVMIGSIKG